METFGRFPDRNTLLGRECTPAEVAFLARGTDVPHLESGVTSPAEKEQEEGAGSTLKRVTSLAASLNQFARRISRGKKVSKE